jgi:hypothetical protein
MIKSIQELLKTFGISDLRRLTGCQKISFFFRIGLFKYFQSEQKKQRDCERVRERGDYFYMGSYC